LKQKKRGEKGRGGEGGRVGETEGEGRREERQSDL